MLFSAQGRFLKKTDSIASNDNDDHDEARGEGRREEKERRTSVQRRKRRAVWWEGRRERNGYERVGRDGFCGGGKRKRPLRVGWWEVPPATGRPASRLRESPANGSARTDGSCGSGGDGM